MNFYSVGYIPKCWFKVGQPLTKVVDNSILYLNFKGQRGTRKGTTAELQVSPGNLTLA